MATRNAPAPVRSARVVLALSAVVLVAVSWFPFRLELPYLHRTSPVRTSGAGGAAVSFDGTAILQSPGEPRWLAEARRRDELVVVVTARTGVPDQRGPARVFVLGEDVFTADLTLGQQGDDLVVRVRRAGSDAVGEPAYVLGDFFAADAARTAEVRIEGRKVTIGVDGAVVVDDEVDAPVLEAWDGGHTLSVGDEPGGERGWVGELQELEVRSGATTTDLLAPGELEPGQGWVLRARINEDVGLQGRDSVALSVARAVSLVPLARRSSSWPAPRRRGAGAGSSWPCSPCPWC